MIKRGHEQITSSIRNCYQGQHKSIGLMTHCKKSEIKHIKREKKRDEAYRENIKRRKYQETAERKKTQGESQKYDYRGVTINDELEEEVQVGANHRNWGSRKDSRNHPKLHPTFSEGIIQETGDIIREE